MMEAQNTKISQNFCKIFRIAITGHANLEPCFGLPVPGSGQSYDPVALEKATQVADTFLNRLADAAQGRPVVILDGMARGWDEIVALAVLASPRNVALELYVPHSVAYHQKRPLRKGMRGQAIHYQKILDSPKTLAVFEIQKNWQGRDFRFANWARNAALVEKSHGTYSFRYFPSPGTDDAIKRAKKLGRYLGNVPTILHSAPTLFQDNGAFRLEP